MRDRLTATIHRLMHGIEQEARTREAEQAKLDPLGHKLTRVFDPGVDLRYRYFKVTSRGRETRYCWATVRNSAGFFLSWREVWNIKQGTGKRDQWASRRQRKQAKAIAASRYKAHRERLATTPARTAPSPS